jgi:uncharacterized protein (DUF342 family)
MESDHPERHGFSLRYQDGQAVLFILPEDKRTRPVYADDITARMKILGIPPVPARRIREIIENGGGEPAALVEWPAGAQLSARVIVKVREDNMLAKAIVDAPRPGGAPVDRKMVAAAMAVEGITTGIDQKAIRILLRGDSPENAIVIAGGKAPVKGRAARTECLFVTDRGKPWQEMSGGRINLKELNFIQNRKIGDLVARHIPELPSEDGYDILGTVIDADPFDNEVLLKAGDGVLETEIGLEAKIDGNVRLVDGEVTVEPTINVKNVDYSTGNIDFDGSVLVEDTVADGFTVRATGDIQVGKTIGRGHLEAGRNLVLSAGLVGDGDGSCIVKGSLYSKFLEGAKAQVSGDLIVTEAVLHSEIEVHGNLILNEGRGEITGGIAAVGGSISCKRIGNVYAGVTRIYVGCPPEKLNSFQKLGAELKTVREEVDEMDRQLDYIKSRSGTDPREISNFEKGISVRTKRLKDGAIELKTIRADLEAAAGTVIAARDRVYPEVSLSFGLEEFPLGDKGLERVMLRRENNQVVVHGLKPGEEISFSSDSAR